MTQANTAVETSDTPHVAKAMKSGLIWNLVNTFASQGAGFVIFLILASRLEPHIFGLVALASILADMISIEGRYSGMDAIVQAKRYDSKYLNSSFLGFMSIAFSCMLILILIAPILANVYNDVTLMMFIPVFGVMLLPIPWLSVMDALIMRNLGFKELTQRNILGTLLGGAAGIAVAFSPWIIWALVVQRFVTLIVSLIFEYTHTKWAPNFRLSIPECIDFIKRFIPLWAVSTLNLATPRIATMVFGARYGAAEVGLLRAAFRIEESMRGPLISPLQGLWFPLMSKVRGQIEKEQEVYLTILRTAAFVALPAFAGIALVANDIVAIILPKTYADVGPLMEAVAIIGLLIPISWFNSLSMNSLEMNKEALIYTIVKVVTATIALLAFTNVSPPQALLIMAAPSIILGIGGNYIVMKRLKLSLVRHYLGLFPAIFAAFIMALCVWMVREFIVDWPALLRLITSAGLGAIIYIGWIAAFFPNWMKERINLLRGRGNAEI
ncbi:oligosaccharide flippase family protein [Hirschia maritima]|uniref:oligosaccharide flippase family protein n=1 Tax=Hirschia maritima TaxID=1121961 RepID=UPI00037B2DB6|nr:oligosaccharide flippase family protein [Hirschia maritima]